MAVITLGFALFIGLSTNFSLAVGVRGAISFLFQMELWTNMLPAETLKFEHEACLIMKYCHSSTLLDKAISESLFFYGRLLFLKCERYCNRYCNLWFHSSCRLFHIFRRWGYYISKWHAVPILIIEKYTWPGNCK
jgi:hypothetical protein